MKAAYIEFPVGLHAGINRTLIASVALLHYAPWDDLLGSKVVHFAVLCEKELDKRQAVCIYHGFSKNNIPTVSNINSHMTSKPCLYGEFPYGGFLLIESLVNRISHLVDSSRRNQNQDVKVSSNWNQHFQALDSNLESSIYYKDYGQGRIKVLGLLHSAGCSYCWSP